MSATENWLRERIRQRDERIAVLKLELATVRGDLVVRDAELEHLRKENRELRELHGTEAFKPTDHPAEWGG